VEGRGVSRVKKRKQKKSVVISDGMKRALPPFFFYGASPPPSMATCPYSIPTPPLAFDSPRMAAV